VLLNQRDGESTLSGIKGTSATNNATADDKNIEWTCRICRSHSGQSPCARSTIEHV